MTAASATFCHHCGLPLGLRPSQRRLGGTYRSFCCYGCTLAFQVRHGSFEETRETHALIRLGVGAFLAMNIMLLSLLLYSGALDLEWDQLRQLVHIALWLLATPAVAILAGPFVQEAWQEARRA
jgi:Cu2+-exporting ATPase